MHNAGYNALGLNYTLLAFKVVDLKSAIAGFRALNVRGIIVTIPHKQEVMKYVDQIDETAQKIGAVNTIVNTDGQLTAYNTDWIGALLALEEKTVLDGKTIAVLGAGGAARAIIYALKTKKTKIFVFNRSLKQAQELAEDFQLDGAYGLDKTKLISNTDIIINTTPLGMEPHENNSPLPASSIKETHLIFDIVYTPNRTKLLQLAIKNHARVVYGYKMVLYGGAKIFELLTGKKAPLKVMEKALTGGLHKYA